MSDKELNFSELFEKSKTKPRRNPTTGTVSKQNPQPIYDAHYIENIPFDIDAIPKSYQKDGVNRASLRRFKKNYSIIKAHSIDLHHHTRIEAAEALTDYIAQCQNDGISYFLVIFGKGLSSSKKPVLKKIECAYLINYPEVLAYEFAKPGDGGDGAAYVMLRKQ